MTDYPRFSDAESRRRQLARALMRREGLSALVIFGNSGINRHNQANVFCLTNYLDLHHNHLIFPLDGEPTLLKGLVNRVPQARMISAIADTHWGGYDPAKEIAGALKRCGGGHSRVGLVGVNATFGTGMPYRHFLALSDALPEVGWADVTSDFAWKASEPDYRRILRLVSLAHDRCSEG